MKLVATDTPQFIPGTGELVWQPTPSIQRILHLPHVACAHVRFFLSDRNPSAGFTSPGHPSTCLKSRTTEIPLFPKTLSSGIARARARAISRSFGHPPYSVHVNARKRNPDQPGQSGGKAGTGWSNHFAQCAWVLPLASRWTVGYVAHARATEQGIPARFACLGERRKAVGSDTPPLACAASDGCEGMRSRLPIAVRYGALSVVGWV